MRHYKPTLFFILSLIALSVSCSRSTRLERLFDRQSPYEKYRLQLEEGHLHHTALGKDWIAAGQNSLHDSLRVNIPYQETGYLAPDAPQAISFRYFVREGQRLQIRLQPLTQPEARFFLDVFSVEADSSLRPLYHSDSLPQISYEAERDTWHLLRVQPELLRGGAYTLELRAGPSLPFPVDGRDSQAVQSFFGAPRDGGRRSHKGIDIFAPRGTPVLAVARGVIDHRTSSGRGGKVVWLRSPDKGFRLYYAHLDSQLVRPGQRVQAGDTLGFVGNTGNARSTPPHLHFSIYRFGRGAVDPFPFVDAPDIDPLLAAESSELGIYARTTASMSNIRQAPRLSSERVGRVSRHSWLQVEGKSKDWFRVSLADGLRGYVHQSLVEPLSSPLQTIRLRDIEALPFSEDYRDTLPPDYRVSGELNILALYKNSEFVRTEQGYYGWISLNRDDENKI